jgi:hypothetical protein
MTSVFISYSSNDHDLVRSLVVQPLEKHGLHVWFSKDSIHGAEDWEKRIRPALVSNDWFLVALSPNSVRSEWVRAEVDWALDNRKDWLVPVLIGDCNPEDCHLRLRQIQYIDLRQGNPAGKAALLNLPWHGPPQGQGNEAQLLEPSDSTKKDNPSGKMNRLRWLVAALVVVIAAALGA